MAAHRELFEAVLNDAFVAEREWFESDEDELPFDFRSLCEYFNLDHGRIRKAIKKGWHLQLIVFGDFYIVAHVEGVLDGETVAAWARRERDRLAQNRTRKGGKGRAPRVRRRSASKVRRPSVRVRA